jgi:hypothetical protein
MVREFARPRRPGCMARRAGWGRSVFMAADDADCATSAGAMLRQQTTTRDLRADQEWLNGMSSTDFSLRKAIWKHAKSSGNRIPDRVDRANFMSSPPSDPPLAADFQTRLRWEPGYLCRNEARKKRPARRMTTRKVSLAKRTHLILILIAQIIP